MTMTSAVSTRISTIGALIREPALLAVPEFQRDYSWTLTEVEQLWDDVELLRTEGRKEHFMGAIVLNAQDNDRKFVVDGQQRLATTMTLLSTLRAKSREHGDNEAAEELQRRFGEKDLSTRKVRPKLQLNEHDDKFFQDWVVKEKAFSEIKGKLAEKHLPESHRLILRAFVFLHGKLSDLMPTQAKFAKTCPFIVDVLDKYLTIVKIEVTTEEAAYWLFETLNDRGLELSVTDLLKNYLLRQAGSYRSDAKRGWNQLQTKISRSNMPTFVRHWWLSANGIVREKELFRHVSKKYKSDGDIVGLLSDLNDAVDPYAALLDTSNSYWSNIDDPSRGAITDHIEELTVFRVTQCYPALLAVLGAVEDSKQIERAFKLITSVSVRFSIATSGRGSGSVEKAFSDLALSIRKAIIRLTDPTQLGSFFLNTERELCRVRPECSPLPR